MYIFMMQAMRYFLCHSFMNILELEVFVVL